MIQPTQTLPAPAPQAPAQVVMNEAPYSWNATVQDPETGFVEQFTVRAISAEGFIQRVGAMKVQLIERGYKPVTRPGNGHNPAPASDNGEQAPICAIHNKPMTKVQGQKGSFWSCHERLSDGTYCPYKPPKAGV